MCGSRGGDSRSVSPPVKLQVIWVSIEISIWTPWKMVDPPGKWWIPPLENGGPLLKPWKSIVFTEIKPLINIKHFDPLCKI